MINIVEPQPFISIVNNSDMYKRILFLEGCCEKYPQIAYLFVLLVVRKAQVILLLELFSY